MSAPSNGNIRWQTWIGIVVGALAVVSSIGGMGYQLATMSSALVGVQKDHAALQDRVDRQFSILSKVQVDTADQRSALDEIETQFCEADHLRNLMHAQDLRWFSMLWEKTFSQKIPTDNVYYPTVCNRRARK